MSRTSRLNTLLRVRRIQEEISRGRLSATVVAERRTQVVLEQARDRYAAPEEEPFVVMVTTEGFLMARRHRGALAGSVSVAGAGVQAASGVTVVARRDWSEAAMRMAALERLKDRAREVARTELLAAEQRTSEESSSATARGPARSVPEAGA